MLRIAPLSQEKIIEAAGTYLGVSEDQLRVFAAELCDELERVFTASATAFPDKEVVDDFIKKMKKLHQIAEAVDASAQSHPFIESLLNVAKRAIPKKKYNSVDVQDIWALSKSAEEWARNARFQNKRKGPDVRMALQVALIVAEYYKKSFKAMPGIGGGGKRGSRSGETGFQETPYQRICTVIAETKNITIGRPVQVEAIGLLEAGQQPAPFFKPDVQSLPEKRTD